MLVIKDIGREYGGRRIVKNVTIEVERSSITALIGPNGAGKTSTFYVAAGILFPDHGSVIMDDRDITSLPIYKRARLGISYLPQESSIFKGMTVYDNVASAISIKIKSRESVSRMTNKLLEEFSISYLSDTKGYSLSGGERKRVEIARCIATFPKYVLLDEPLAGIDPIALTEVRDVIKRLKRHGIGVLITDHNIKEVVKIIDYLYVIYRGEILISGNTADVINDDRVRQLYLGRDFE